MRIKRYLLLVLLAPTAACTTGSEAAKPFTDDWRYYQKQALQVEERQRRLKEDVVLFGQKDKARAAVTLDEKGKPQLNIGKNRGLSADIDIDTNKADVLLKYKIEWGRGERPKDLED